MIVVLSMRFKVLFGIPWWDLRYSCYLKEDVLSMKFKVLCSRCWMREDI